ncbi:MAG: tail fiber protein [Candidatus Thiodiazotropha sp.]
MLVPVPASFATCATDPYLGSICVTAANFCPRGYLPADGRLLPVNDNMALFSLLGTTYGGDGRSSFGVPDLRSRTPVGAGEGLGLTPVQLGLKRGVETRALSLASLPAHSHEAAFEPAPEGGLQASTKNGEAPSPTADSFLGAMKGSGMSTPPSLYTTDDSTLTPIKGLDLDGAVEIGTTGQGQPFSIIPPQLGLLYCIATQGIFPPRN